MIKVEVDDSTRTDFNDLLERVAGYAALPLRLASGQIEKGEAAGNPPSATLQASLIAMIDSPLAVKLVIVTSLPFGSYGEVQKVNAAFALDVEDGVKGAGIGIAVHEMWENFRALTVQASAKKKFGPAHSAALGVESAVVSELRGEQLGRVASRRSPGAGGTTYVLDYQRMYVVIAAIGGGKMGRKCHTAKARGRSAVQSFDLASANLGDPENQKVFTGVAAVLKKSPLATAGVAGVGVAFSNDVRNAITVALGEDYYLEPSAPAEGLEKEDDKGPGADQGDLSTFVDQVTVVHGAPHGQVIISEPTKEG